MEFTCLEKRAVLEITGEDRLTFLQGLISNDITKASESQSLWAGFLSPQGKFQHDLFISVRGESFLLDAEADRLEAFVKRLTLFKLRSKITLRIAPEFSVWAAWGAGAAQAFGLADQAGAAQNLSAGTVMVDPRLAAGGLRLVLISEQAVETLQSKGFGQVPFAQWDHLRLSLGLPDGSRDMQIDGNLLLELGFEELNGVDFKKGCYMGQETTTRSKHRKLIKRRLVPVAIDGPVPASGTPIVIDELEIGHMCSAQGSLGLAFLRVDKLPPAGQALPCGNAHLIPHKPDWAVFPEIEAS